MYSNSVGIKWMHPNSPIIRKMCRVARHGVIRELNPKRTGYPRDYVGQFRKAGFRVEHSTEEDDGPSFIHLCHFGAR